MAAKEFVRGYRENRDSPGEPQATPLSRVEELWDQIYPGAQPPLAGLETVCDQHGQRRQGRIHREPDERRGEGRALFVAARVFSADAGVLVVEEPETHFHSRLAVNCGMSWRMRGPTSGSYT